MPSLRGGRDAVPPPPPPQWLLVLPFLFTKNTVFGISHNTRQQTVMEKLLYINLTQYSVLITRLYGCVAEESCKPAQSLPVSC